MTTDEITDESRDSYDQWHARHEVDAEADSPWHQMIKARLNVERDLAGTQCPWRSAAAAADSRCGWPFSPVAQRNVVACDFSPAAVQMASDHAAAHGISGIRWEVADIQKLEQFQDAEFDTVTSTETIEHVIDPPLAVRQLARVLKPGGRLFLTTPNYFSTIGLYRLYCVVRGKTFDECGQPICHWTQDLADKTLGSRSWAESTRNDILRSFPPLPGPHVDPIALGGMAASDHEVVRLPFVVGVRETERLNRPNCTALAMTTRWAVITGEYPPDKGGVADYTAQVAHGLAAAGDRVTIYAPRNASRGDSVADDGLAVHPCRPLRSARDSRRSTANWLEHRPDRILVQYAPHSFGLRGMNVPLAAWIATRAGRVAPLWIMFHEVAFPFRWRPKHLLLHFAQRLMARLSAGAADRIFVSIPEWEKILRDYCPRVRPAEWLPIPCTVDDAADPEAIAAARARHLVGTRLVGHFGTFGSLIADLLEPSCAMVLERDPSISLLLLGRGSTEFRERFARDHPALASRVSAAGELNADAVAAHLRACDVLLQPYSDGLSTRRTTIMAGLANGCIVISNLGQLSEPDWAAADCVRLAPLPDVEALAAAVRAELDRLPEERAETGRRAATSLPGAIQPELDAGELGSGSASARSAVRRRTVVARQ